MKRIAVTAILLASLASPAAALAAMPTPCQFVLGFKALHELAAAEVGECLDNQAFDATGDARQHTTRGLMAWRKADNLTAFTDGSRTWLVGAEGLVSRPNGE